jgi:hypothetical protein
MWPEIIYLLLVAFLFGSAAIAASRGRRPGASGPGWLVSLLIWAGVIALITVLYEGAQFWGAIGAMLR